MTRTLGSSEGIGGNGIWYQKRKRNAPKLSKPRTDAIWNKVLKQNNGTIGRKLLTKAEKRMEKEGTEYCPFLEQFVKMFVGDRGGTFSRHPIPPGEHWTGHYGTAPDDAGCPRIPGCVYKVTWQIVAVDPTIKVDIDQQVLYNGLRFRKEKKKLTAAQWKKQTWHEHGDQCIKELEEAEAWRKWAIAFRAFAAKVLPVVSAPGFDTVSMTRRGVKA
jgi:hypothetical protein